MRIVALDPGGTTGFAFHDTETGKWHRRQLTGKHHLELDDTIAMFAPDVLCWENFNYQRRELDKGVSLVLVSVEYIGIAERYCQLAHIDSYSKNSTHVKNLVGDDKLIKLDLLVTPKTPNRHANDATRVLVYYMIDELKLDKILEQLKP